MSTRMHIRAAVQWNIERHQHTEYNLFDYGIKLCTTTAYTHTHANTTTHTVAVQAQT